MKNFMVRLLVALALLAAPGLAAAQGVGLGQINASSTAGTVGTVSVTTTNGLAGSVANPTTSPAISLSTTVTGLLKGDGTAISAASAGADYVVPDGALGTPSSGTLTNTTGFPVANLSGTTLPSGVTASSLTSLGTLSSLAVTGTSVFTSASSASLVVGPNGATNPVLRVDGSTGSQASGIRITGSTAAGNVTLQSITSGTNAGLIVGGIGNGTLGLNANSTGRVTITPVTTITGALTLSAVGLVYNGVTLTGTTGTGNMVLSAAPTFTGTMNSADLVITSASASSLVVGRLGATTPAFTVDSSTGTQVAGLKLTGAATGGTVALVATDSGSNTNLTFNAKGSGTMGIGTTSTGTVTIAATATPTTIPSTTITIAGVTTGTNADTLCLSAGGVILLQAAACTISSARFKKNIAPLGSSALGIIERLQPVTFNMKGENRDPNYARLQIGLIAEDVEAVDERLAIYEDDLITPKSYRQESVIALLVGSVKELKVANDNLTAEVIQLKRRAKEARFFCPTVDGILHEASSEMECAALILKVAR